MADQQVIRIPVGQIEASPTNPRKCGFGVDDLADLTASIRAGGVKYPVMVRVHPTRPLLDAKGRDLPVPYQLIDGERRFRAALFAGLPDIPAVVVQMTDQEVRGAQLLSFDQKKDLLPSERAAAYQAEIDAGRAVDDLARLLGGVLDLGPAVRPADLPRTRDLAAARVTEWAAIEPAEG